jgi:hypothetical protein
VDLQSYSNCNAMVYTWSFSVGENHGYSLYLCPDR